MKLIGLFFVYACVMTIKLSAQQNEFKLCEPGRKWGGIILQYYHVSTAYEGGLRKIKEHFFKRYVSPYGNHDTGYLTLRFMINCKGEVGAIETLGCTTEFKEKNFDKQIVDQLIGLLMGLDKWKAGKTTDGVAIDSQKYLTFILINGSLKDIVPK